MYRDTNLDFSKQDPNKMQKVPIPKQSSNHDKIKMT